MYLFAPAAVILIGLFACQCHGTGEGVITLGPQTQIVSPGEMVYFNCYARGNTVYMYINGRDPFPQNEYEARGFNFTYLVTDNEQPGELDEHNNTIIVEARPSNNNTRIACSAQGNVHNQIDFQEGTLIIAGRPLSPKLDMIQEYIAGNIFVYHLNWSAPFTWPGFPIISYDVTVYNQSSNKTDTSTMITNGSHLLSLTHQVTSSGDDCYMLNFSVTANNRVGSGEPAIINSGHPIVPGEIGDIETALTFQSNGTPHFWMSFSLPRICPGYQTGTYNITIFDNDGAQVYRFGSTQYTQSEDDQVKEVKSGLIYGKNYTVKVMASSLGIFRSKTEKFNTLIDTDIVCLPLHNTMSESAISDTQSCSASSAGENHLALIVGISVGVTSFLLTCCCLVAVMMMLCRTRKKSRQIFPSMPRLETDSSFAPKPKKAKPPSLSLQARNPIYEGALYEITPGECIKSLMSPCSVPCTPIAESASRYTFDFPPRLPPPRKGSVSIPPKLETHDEIDAKKGSLDNGELPDQLQAGDNEYMEMNGGMPKKENCTYAAVKKKALEDEYVSLK